MFETHLLTHLPFRVVVPMAEPGFLKRLHHPNFEGHNVAFGQDCMINRFGPCWVDMTEWSWKYQSFLFAGASTLTALAFQGSASVTGCIGAENRFDAIFAPKNVWESLALHRLLQSRRPGQVAYVAFEFLWHPEIFGLE